MKLLSIALLAVVCTLTGQARESPHVLGGVPADASAPLLTSHSCTGCLIVDVHVVGGGGTLKNHTECTWIATVSDSTGRRLASNELNTLWWDAQSAGVAGYSGPSNNGVSGLDYVVGTLQVTMHVWAEDIYGNTGSGYDHHYVDWDGQECVF